MTTSFASSQSTFHKSSYPISPLYFNWDSRIEMRERGCPILSDKARAVFFEIVEQTMCISNLAHFKKWTQTELQRIFPHGMLACGIGRLGKKGAHIQHVICSNFPLEYVKTLQHPDGLTSSPMLFQWMRTQEPILFEPDLDTASNDFPSDWLNNFRKFELVNVAAHGICDFDKHTASYFSFSNVPGPLSQTHAYMLKLLVPHLHVALTRAIFNSAYKKPNTSKKQTLLTRREKEILQWLATGKSNWEIAQVIGLCEATVKNHVHHLLQKLQVSTRAQAVARAAQLRLIRTN